MRNDLTPAWAQNFYSALLTLPAPRSRVCLGNRPDRDPIRYLLRLYEQLIMQVLPAGLQGKRRYVGERILGAAQTSAQYLSHGRFALGGLQQIRLRAIGAAFDI